MKKISVIIPVYNMEKYLSKCLDTVVSQSFYDNLEILCINDGSTDTSLQILQKYATQYKNIIIINQKNAGVGITRNNGIQEASGEFVAFMDPDDYYIESDTLESLYLAATKHNVMICGGSLCEDHNNGKRIRKEFEGIYKKFTFCKEQLISYSDYQFDYGFYRFIYNREFLIRNHIYFPPLIRFQDPPFLVTAMIQAKQFYAIPNYVYCYRCGHQNITWQEERICALLQGLIENLKLSSAAGLGELHALTLQRFVEFSKDYIIEGIRNKSYKVIQLLEEAEHCINTDILPPNSSVTSIYQFYFNYFIEAEKIKETFQSLPLVRLKRYTKAFGVKIKKVLTRKNVERTSLW